MQPYNSIRFRRGAKICKLCLLLALLFGLALPSSAKVNVDFDPGVDFSKFKTFSFVGPVENLVMIQLNPDLINTRMHNMVVRELGKKGLHEVNPGQHPDLVVRYWTVPDGQVNVAVMGNWAPYNAYIDGRWTNAYNAAAGASKRETTLILDLIDAKAKALVWRVYMTHKLSEPDKDWKRAEDEFIEGFKSYPPSGKDKEDKHAK